MCRKFLNRRNLNIPNKSWEKIQNFVSLSEKCSKTHQECVHKLSWLIFLPVTLKVLMCIKYSCETKCETKTMCPITTYKVPKSEIGGH